MLSFRLLTVVPVVVKGVGSAVGMNAGPGGSQLSPTPFGGGVGVRVGVLVRVRVGVAVSAITERPRSRVGVGVGVARTGVPLARRRNE